MLRPEPVEVTTLNGHVLKILFDNGELKNFDAKPLMSGNWYGMLSDDDYFRRARIEGGTVVWPDGQDVCPDDLYYLSVNDF